jgi:PhnB protein
MAYVSIYLNFMGNAEEAFNHYKKVFKTEFSAPIMRMSDIPPAPGMSACSDADKKKVMHVALLYLAAHKLWQPICLKVWGID